jgi:hypothetical protein
MKRRLRGAVEVGTNKAREVKVGNNRKPREGLTVILIMWSIG